MTTLPSRALDCLGDLVVPSVTPQGMVAAQQMPAGLLLFVGFLALFLITDVVLLLLGLPTMSQALQRFFRDHPWRELVAWMIWLTVGWHIIRGFPWHWR